MTLSSDTQAYEAGDLPRSGSGYEWRSEATVLRPAFDAEDLPPGTVTLRPPSGEPGPWLVPADPLVLSFGHPPPWGRGLLRRFAGLRRPEDMAAFAAQHGLLGEPVTLKLPDGRWVDGEPLRLWEQEVEAVRELAGALDEAAKAAEDVRFHQALAGRFSLQPLSGGQPELTFLYGSQSMPVTSGMTGVLHRPADLVDAWRRVKALDGSRRDIERLAERVRGCVQRAIESRLQDRHVGIRYRDYQKPGAQPPVIVPSTLLGAIYLQLDRKVRTVPGHKSPRPMVACAWGPCPNWVEPKRVQPRYFCKEDPNCRKNFQRQQDREHPERVAKRKADLEAKRKREVGSGRVEGKA